MGVFWRASLVTRITTDRNAMLLTGLWEIDASVCKIFSRISYCMALKFKSGVYTCTCIISERNNAPVVSRLLPGHYRKQHSYGMISFPVGEIQCSVHK